MGNDFDKRDPRRFRVTVPADDESVIEWLDCQHSVSMSLRMLVRAAIEAYGMRDYFATESGEITQRPKRGRPARDESVQQQTVQAPQVDADKPAKRSVEPVEEAPVEDIPVEEAPKPVPAEHVQAQPMESGVDEERRQKLTKQLTDMVNFGSK